MFGINYSKFDAMTYVIHYANGSIKREGRGLSFFYYSPTSSIVVVPLGSRDIHFIFNATTKDFQNVTIQGQITYDRKPKATFGDARFYTNPRYERQG